ncbi:MAG: hypothetical protein WC548_03245 [Candidatus Pacearchaeota archaeon]
MKPYKWEEIRNFFINQLTNSKHIMTFGTIGSCNVEHDLDIIITKTPSSKISDFYREIHNLFDLLNNYLSKKYSARVICFSGYEPEFLQLSNFKEKDLAIQLMTYVSYSQIYHDWFWAIFPNEDIKNILIKNYNCLFGSVAELFSLEFNSKEYNPLYIYLMMYNRVNSNYEEDFLIKVMSHYFDFLYRKRLGFKTPIPKSKKDVKKYFYKLCDIADSHVENKFIKNGR